MTYAFEPFAPITVKPSVTLEYSLDPVDGMEFAAATTSFRDVVTNARIGYFSMLA